MPCPSCPLCSRAPKTRHFTSYKQATDHELRTSGPVALGITACDALALSDQFDIKQNEQRQKLPRGADKTMKSPICDMLGIEFPLLAFSHCRDVVAAVSRAGGFGVLGATSHSP